MGSRKKLLPTKETDDESETFQIQESEIEESDESFDPNAPIESWEQYLLHMLYERGKFPKTIRRVPIFKKHFVPNYIKIQDDINKVSFYIYIKSETNFSNL